MDSYSDDGTFELLQQFAKKDSRVQVYQAERDGSTQTSIAASRALAGIASTSQLAMTRWHSTLLKS